MTGTDARPVGRYAPAEGPSAHYPPARYPSARRLELVEQLYGRAVADPSRWLEDPAGPRTTDELCCLAQYTGLDLEAVCTG